MTTFAGLDLIESLQRAVADQGYESPTPIQAQAIPLLLDGRDVLGCAQTGTGKTAAFSLPILQHMAEHPGPRGRRRIRALVLTPTRELAAQIGECFDAYGKYLATKHTVIFGGVNERPQIRTLKEGIEVLVATPGRLLDLLGRGFVDLSAVEFFVLDEADRMLDMGFVHDVRRVLKVLPNDRQNLLFSATLPDSIRKLAGSFLHDPEHVAVTPEKPTVEKIDQSIMFVEKGDKRHLLVDLLRPNEVARVMVFTRTKHGANRLTKQLNKANVSALAIHGNKSQGARQRALASFKSGEVQVLVATDIASRGIDVDEVTHVFNFDLPNEPESYVHRIGRTARAGREGVAVSFCDPSESDYLRAIEKLTGQSIPRVLDHDYHCQEAVPVAGRRSSVPPPHVQQATRARERSSQRGGRPRSSRGGSRGPRRGQDQGRSPEARPSTPRRRSSAPRGTGASTDARPAASGGRSRSSGNANVPSFGGGGGGGGSRGRRSDGERSDGGGGGGGGGSRGRRRRRR